MKSESEQRELVNGEILKLVADLKKLIEYASQIEESIMPSITLMPTLLANLTDELKQTRHGLEKLSQKIV